MSLCKRHLLVYFRDKWAVFFSFLSVIIILGLFVLFMGQMQENSLADFSQEHVDYLVYSWILSGVLMVGTVTIPLGFMGNMVNDTENKVIHDFYVSPLKRSKVVLSYLLAAFIATLILSTANMLVGFLVLYLVTGEMMSVLNVFKVIGVMIILTGFFSSLFYYLCTFVKTANAHSTLSTLIGTMIGFLAGLYVPIGSFSSTIRNSLTALPTMQGAGLMRKVYMEDAMDKVFMGNTTGQTSYAEYFGVNLSLFNQELTLWILVLFMVIWFFGFLAAALIRMKRFKKER